MTFSFRNQRDALHAKHGGRQRPPAGRYAQVAAEPAQYGTRQFATNANYIVKTPQDGIPARDQDTPGKAVCDVQYIDETSEDLTNSQMTDVANVGGNRVLQITVYNLQTEEIEGDTRITVWQVGDKWVVGSPLSSESYPWIRVRVQINQDLYSNNQPSVVWSTAQYRSYEPFTEPIPTQPTGIANPFRIDAQADSYIWISRYQNEAEPGEEPIDYWFVMDSEEYYAREVEADVVSGSAGTFTLDPVSWANGNSPGQITWNANLQLPLYLHPSVPASGTNYDRVQMTFNANVNEYFWTNDTRYQAKWVYGRITIPGDTSQNTCVSLPMTLEGTCGTPGYYDGHDPGQTVNVKVFVPFTCPDPRTIRGWANYRREAGPNQGEYILMNSESAFMGPPTAKTVGDPNTTKFKCDVENGQFCFTQEQSTIYTFACPEQPPDPDAEPPELVCVDSTEFLDCLNLCEYICLYCDTYSGPLDCNDEKNCCGDCEFADPWVLALTITVDALTVKSIDGVTKVDDCTWNVPMDDETTAVVTYETADGVYTVTWDGSQYTLSFPATPCKGGTDTQGNVTIELSMNGAACDSSSCCQGSWNPGVSIQNFSSGPGGGVEMLQNGPSVKTGPCTFEVPLDVNYLDPGFAGAPTTIPGTATLTYDEANGKWRVDTNPTEIPTSEPFGPPAIKGGFEVDPGTCCGLQACNTLGPAGCMDEEVTNTSGTFEVVDCTSTPSALTALSSVAVTGMEKPGDKLAQTYPEMFPRGGGCKCRDAKALLNTWSSEKIVSDIDRLVSQFRKGSGYVAGLTAEEIKRRILGGL